MLSDPTKRNASLSIRDTSPWWATNIEECDVVWRNRYSLLYCTPRLLLPKPLCIIVEQGDISRPAAESSEPSEAVKEYEKKRSTQNVVFSRFMKSKSIFTQLHCI